MSILLLGAQGQVGQALIEPLTSLSSSGSVVAVGRSQLDLTDLGAIKTKIAALQPQLIVNAAAYTAVDKAESEPELAYRINAEAPGVIAQSAAECGAALVHISTDYVFSGQIGSPRCETDATGPLSVYGKTKLAGEEAIRQALTSHIILRTAWVYGAPGKGNFLKTMLRLGKAQREVNVVADQVGSPTWASDLAAAIAQLSKNAAALPGTYHYTNSGVASWYDFAVAIFQEAKALGLPLKVQTVNPMTTADYPTPAQRPAYSVLNCQKVARILGHSAPHWRQSLRAMLTDYTEIL
ncbi:MAG: dTDP-4-dehydrorhamnose reductase [Phormidesmis sp.]